MEPPGVIADLRWDQPGADHGTALLTGRSVGAET